MELFSFKESPSQNLILHRIFIWEEGGFYLIQRGFEQNRLDLTRGAVYGYAGHALRRPQGT